MNEEVAVQAETTEESELAELVIFSLEGRRYGLPLSFVHRVVLAVDVTPLPTAPAVVLGVIDVAGAILPVLSLRRRFGLPDGPLQLSDHFLIVSAGQRNVALVVDATEGVSRIAMKDIIKPAAISPRLEHIKGVVQLADGLILIQDLDTVLSLDEAEALDDAVFLGGGL